VTSVIAAREPALPRRRARLGAYALWQFRDYALNRGAPTLIVALLFGYLGVAQMLARLRAASEQMPPRLIAQYGSVDAALLAMRHDMSTAFLSSFVGTIVFLGALFATNGIVANDRKQGFFRFLFAKPVTPPAYYGAEFVVNGIGFLVIVAGLGLLYGTLMVPALSGTLLGTTALVYLCYAGLAFALSAATRWDWLGLVAAAGAAEILWPMFGHSKSVFTPLLYLLPPVHRTGAVYEAAVRGVALPWHSLLWFGGYGAAAFVAGLLILRYRRLAII
jgi:hypothetical protein